MTRRTIRTLRHDERGAVAATYALALTGLLMIGGVAFDYGRMVTMDTELQAAADQAALAAATQLNGTPDSINRAVAQASALVSNHTMLSNDGDADRSLVTVSSVVFFQTRADAEAGTNGFTDNSQSSRAHFVRVIMDARQAYYALTPIVGAVASPDIAAVATAGLGSAVCKVPPLMMCNPATVTSAVDVDSLIGKGLRLKGTGGGGAWAPGDFGFLDAGAGASDLGRLVAYATPPANCVELGTPTTEPGAITSVINDFNTRFDIFDGGDNINCWSRSLCPPSDNSRKDVVQQVVGNGNGGNLSQQDCGMSTGGGNRGWRFSPNPYRPVSNQTYAQHIAAGTKTAYPDVMGYPRDMCHATSASASCSGSANGRIGDGAWDIGAYWQSNFGTGWAGQVTTTVSGRSYPTRYEIYKWERANPPTPDPKQVASGGNNYRNYRAPVCRTGSAPAATRPDRRVLPIAVIDCTGLSGKAQVTPLEWVDVFLVEPSLDRSFNGTAYTERGDIYVEVIGRTGQGSGGTGNQYVRRDKPYLVN